MKQLLKKEVSCFCDDPKLKSLANSSKSDLISDICKGDNCIKTEYPLNECFIGNINPHHPSNYTIKINNQEEKQRSSGILISTGTGSSAWYYAMGGRKFKRTKKQLRFRIREPFTGRLYKVAIKSGKINPNKKLEIISLMHHGFLAIDSIRTYKLSMNDKIEISLGKPLRVVH
ncbi:MAG: hypothetical protein Q7S33_01370, partial [Nanoarchaeota archaeon]|nr:hypothetical protein [Nanoarchaeota archaeon]